MKKPRRGAGGEKVIAAICIAGIWGAALVGVALMERWAPEQMTWYRWYAPIVTAIGTLNVLLLGGII